MEALQLGQQLIPFPLTVAPGRTIAENEPGIYGEDLVRCLFSVGWLTSRTGSSKGLVLDPLQLYLVSDPVLEELGFLHHTALGILICHTCQHALFPTEVISHARQHHKVPKKHCNTPLLEAYCSTHGLHDVLSMVPSLAPKGTPVESIKEHQGLACRLDPGRCNYCCKARKAMDNHMRSQHPHSQQFPLSKCYRSEVTVQTLFHGASKRYFEVEPTLHAVTGPLDPLPLILHHFSSTQATWEPLPAMSPEAERERMPFMRIVGWDIHLKDIQPHRSERKLLHSLTGPADPCAEPGYSALLEHILLYIQLGMKIGWEDGKAILVRYHLYQGAELQSTS